MKSIYITIFLMFCLNGFAQTIEREKEFLNDLIQNGNKSQSELKQIGFAWSDLLEEFGGYPNLPYNEEFDRIEFVKVYEIPRASKTQLFKGVKEWIAINYGSIKHVIHYEDEETGKIIGKGWSDLEIKDIKKDFWGNPESVIRSVKCYHTIILTIRENKIKVEFNNITYESVSGGYFQGTLYVPIEENEYPISYLYPVTNKDKSTWVSRLSTLENTNKTIELSQKSLLYYLKNNLKDDF